MAQIMTHIYDGYRDLMDNKSDPRVNDWPMMSSPLPTLVLCVSYAYFSRSLGPRFMANRKPFNLREVLIVYNLLQTLFSAWIFYEYLQSGWWGHYDFRCQPVDYSRSPLAMRMVHVCWWYYFSKFTEFFDTLFFVLRKKNNHVSTLHVIHHGVMPFSVWMGLKFAPGGHSTFFALLNTFVHIIMYFYYMVAAMGPRYQKYIWWKKYLTTFQMLQFVAIFTHQLQLLFRECDYPKSFVVWIAIHGFLFLFLFSGFYKSSYTSKQRSLKKLEDERKNTGLCMAVLDEEKKSNGTNGTNGYKNHNGVSNGYAHTNGTNGITNGYVTTKNEPLDAYYSNGVNNGFVKDIRNGLKHRDWGQKDQ